MATTVDQFYNSAAQVSARRTSAIRDALSIASPKYFGRSKEALERIPQNLDSRTIDTLKSWAESRDKRSLVHAKAGTSQQILSSGSFYTAHDLKGVGHTGGMTTENNLVAIRAGREVEQGLPYYDVSKGQGDPISGLRPVSGENIPKNLSDVQASKLRAIYGEDIPIMHNYAYGSDVVKSQLGFQQYGASGSKSGYGERIILRPETSGRTKITLGDYLSDKNPTIFLDEMSEGANSAALIGTDVDTISTIAQRSSADHLKSGSRGYTKLETMTLGVGMHDIEAMIVAPGHISVDDLSDPLKRISAMNTAHGSFLDVGRMIHQSEQRMLASKYGIDYVQDIDQFRTEMHNPAMTKKFIEMQGLSNVQMDNLPKSATPLEAYLTSIKRGIDSGSTDIVGLGGMSSGDRGFVSETIQKHLNEYGMAKNKPFSATVDQAMKTNVGKITDVRTRAESMPMFQHIKKVDEMVSAKVASNAVPEKAFESAAVAVRRAAPTRQMMTASADAAAAVASKNSIGMRLAGAAATILRKRAI